MYCVVLPVQDNVEAIRHPDGAVTEYVAVHDEVIDWVIGSTVLAVDFVVVYHQLATQQYNSHTEHSEEYEQPMVHYSVDTEEQCCLTNREKT